MPRSAPLRRLPAIMLAAGLLVVGVHDAAAQRPERPPPGRERGMERLRERERPSDDRQRAAPCRSRGSLLGAIAGGLLGGRRSDGAGAGRAFDAPDGRPC